MAPRTLKTISDLYMGESVIAMALISTSLISSRSVDVLILRYTIVYEKLRSGKDIETGMRQSSMPSYSMVNITYLQDMLGKHHVRDHEA
jgi:hypothetical protein